VVKKVTDLGFDTFTQNAQIESFKQLKGSFFDRFADHVTSQLDVNPDLQPIVKGYLEQAQFAKANTWNMYRTMYSVHNSSDANYFCLMTNRNDQNNFDVYMVQMSNSFKLEPDLLVIRNSTSELGGLFSDSTENVYKTPHTLTKNDLKTLLDYFDLISYNSFMKYFGKAPPSYPTEIEVFHPSSVHELTASHKVQFLPVFMAVLTAV
jgi:hypothetical protein